MPDFFILLSPHLRLRSLVNRASDSGSEGRAFESHRGHWKILDNQLIIEDFFIEYITLQMRNYALISLIYHPCFLIVS